ncbi:MAG: patatin-like phospholipase family protein, partial [Actinomycetes bacterium]
MESSEHPGDSPALPISFSAKYGSGHRRAVVLGGGGVAAVSWQVAYLDELAKGGLDLRSSDLIVGTSAGSVVGSLLAGGRIGGAARELGLLTKVPALVAAMAPIGELKASQKRATMMFRQATDAALPTVQAIGYAALAADSPPAAQLPRTLLAVARIRSWGSDGLRIVTTDAYSG